MAGSNASCNSLGSFSAGFVLHETDIEGVKAGAGKNLQSYQNLINTRLKSNTSAML